MKPYNYGQVLYLKWLLYGMPGSTKTRTAYTAAFDKRTTPCLVLESAGNPLSTRDYTEKPDIITMDTLEDYNQPYNWLATGQNPKDPFCVAYNLHPPYRCVIVDGVTEVQRMSFKVATGAQMVGPGSFSAPAQRQHFGVVLQQMVNFARLYLALPMHVILTCLEKQERDDITGGITIAPLLWGQSDTEVGGYAFAVSRMVHRSALADGVLKILEDPKSGGGSVISVALFKPSGKYVAKDQYGKLGDLMVDPTVTKVLDAIGVPMPTTPTAP